MFGMKKNGASTAKNADNKETSKASGFFGKLGSFLKKHLKLIIILLVILGIVGYVQYSAKKAKELLEAEANKPVTATVEQMDLQKSTSVTGTLTAKETKKVTSTIGGGAVTGIKVKKVNYEVGDYVEAGTVVVEFDGQDYDRKISELNAQYNIDNTESAKSISDLQKKITDLQKEIEDDQKWLDDNEIYYLDVKDAHDNYLKYPYSAERERYLTQNQAIQEKYNFTLESYEEKQKNLEKKQDEIKDYQTQIEIAQLKQQYAQNYTQVDAKDDVYESKDATHVAAPISGYIITMNVEEGNNYAQGNVVFTIADTSEFVVEATVNEYDIANITEGLPAKVKFESTGDETFDGEVTFASLASESVVNAGANQGTGSNVATYKVKIKMDKVDKRMRVGMTAKASVVMDSVKNVICVPYDCIQKSEDDDSYFVTTIDDKGNKKDVKITKGLESDYYVEVKGDGLKKGMTVEEILADGPSTDLMDYMYME